MANELPDGIELAHSHWGEPKTDTTMQLATSGTTLSHSGVPYTGDKAREKKCKANNDTCNGWHIKGGDLCSMHAGLVRKPTSEPG